MTTAAKTRKRVWGQFAAGMVLYAVLVVATSLTVDRFDLIRPYLVALALLPMIPAVLGHARLDSRGQDV